MDLKTRLIRLASMVSIALLLNLAAAPASVATIQAQSSGYHTRIRASGLSAAVFLDEGKPEGFSGVGFVNPSVDRTTNTKWLEFSYSVAHPTDPNLAIVFQGADVIPDTALTITPTSAHLALTTPEYYLTTRCVVDLTTGESSCVRPSGPMTFDLTWVINGYGITHETTKRIETLGPVTTKFDGEVTSRTASVSGTWHGETGPISNSGLSGTLYDSGSKTYTREITVAANP